jgi:hypothetical protein
MVLLIGPANIAQTGQQDSSLKYSLAAWRGAVEGLLCCRRRRREKRIERTKLEFRILQFQVREREQEDLIYGFKSSSTMSWQVASIVPTISMKAGRQRNLLAIASPTFSFSLPSSVVPIGPSLQQHRWYAGRRGSTFRLTHTHKALARLSSCFVATCHL